MPIRQSLAWPITLSSSSPPVGETVYLFDPSAYTIDSVTTPILGSDTSWALLPDGTWQEVSYVSPGYENTEAGAEQYRVDGGECSDGAVIINEVMALSRPRSGLADEDGELELTGSSCITPPTRPSA